MTYDLLIRGGTVVDGSGLPGFRADVGITGEVIAEIGDLSGSQARQTIDAEGLIVAPGFVDAHTHMDAQIFWDPIGANSCWYGVTSVVMGNCGFTIAPCAAKDKRLVFSNLERAEDISPEAMEAGIEWSWETFPEYLDAVDRLPKGLNYATYVGHSAVRTHVMGERAFTEKATEDDVRRMRRQVGEAMRAGAVGLSTSRSGAHRTVEGTPVASRIGDWSEVEELVDVLAEEGTGVFEIARGTGNATPDEIVAEIDRMKALAIDSGVPVTFGCTWYSRKKPDQWRQQFAMVDDMVAAGAKVLIQGTSMWSGSLRSFETGTMFDSFPVWSEFRSLPLAEQERGLGDPALRQKLVQAVKTTERSNDPSLPNFLRRDVDWDWIFPQDREMPPYRSVGEIARERGADPVETFLLLALEGKLKTFFLNPNGNEDETFLKALIDHPNTAVTFTDSGAHNTTTLNPVQAYLLGHWVRDRKAVTLEAAIRKVTFDLAAFWGLRRRGLLRQGYFGDVVIFDLGKIQPQRPTLARDLPTGVPRLSQKADGIKATVVNGQVLIRDNQHTGAVPGRLLKNGRAGSNA
jgi:N-acyl-D-amino-acid deacylase